MSDPRIPEWQLERYLLRELAPREEEALRAALHESAPDRLRLQALEESSAEFLQAHPAGEVAATIRARLSMAGQGPAVGSARRWWWPAWQPALIAVTVVAAAGLTISTITSQWPGARSAAETRVKGLEPQLTLYRKTPAGIEQLEPGTVAHKGDVVQILYQAAGGKYGVIVSVDGRGVVTRHLPDQGAAAAQLQRNQLVPLPAAYQLDDAPRFECFYLVTSDRPFEIATVLEALRRRAAGSNGVEAPSALELPRGLDQHAFVLAKEGAP